VSLRTRPAAAIYQVNFPLIPMSKTTQPKDFHIASISRADLDTLGYRTGSNAKWRDMSVARILTDTSAKGVRHYNTTRKTGMWSSEPRPESEWISVPVEPIVSEELWNNVNQILEEQSKQENKPGKKPSQLFAGLAVCHCGRKMYVPSNSPKYICKACRTKIPIVDLEEIVYDELKAYFANPESVARHLVNAGQHLAENQQLLQVQKGEIGKVREQMKKTQELYLADQISKEGFGEIYKPLEERLTSLQTEVATLEGRIDATKLDHLNAEEILTEATTLYARWPQFSVDQKRKTLDGILEKVVIGPDDAIELNLTYQPTSEEMVHSQQRLGPRGACQPWAE